MVRLLYWSNLALVVAAIALQAFVRITDAGCAEWPTCGGVWWENSSDSPIFMALSLRYLVCTTIVFGLFVAVAAMRDRRRAIVVAAVLQSLIAAAWLATDWLALQPGWHGGAAALAVCLRLTVAVLAFIALYLLDLRRAPPVEVSAGRGLALYGQVCILAVVVASAFGILTSVRGAALACPEFPTCLGQWWPRADYWGAVIDWRGTHHPGAVAIAAHWLHRVAALVALLFLITLSLAVTGLPKLPRLSRAGVWLGAVLLAQTGLGLAIVVYRPPLWVNILHDIGAAALLLTTLAVVMELHRRRNGVVALEPVAELDADAANLFAAVQWAEPLPAVSVPLPAVPAQGMPPPAMPGTVLAKLRRRLSNTRAGLLGILQARSDPVDEAVLDDLEAALLMADVGIEATREILQNLREETARAMLSEPAALRARLKQNMLQLLQACEQPWLIPENVRPYVLLVVGVNGVGKTTTIGKLAKRLQNQGLSVMLAAGDTFRAAAVEQLQAWGAQNTVPVVAQHTGADSASVIYDAMQAAQARHIDVLIADTAGRLHTKSNLMEELKKVKRILAKLDTHAPHEVLMVLDATTGQNAIAQVRQFHESVTVTGLALTKLDGSAKGGVLFALAKHFGMPIRFIGVGEGVDDLEPFDAARFIDALFDGEGVDGEAVTVH